MMHGQQVENLWRGGMQAGSDSKLVKNTWPLCPTGMWFVHGGFLAVIEMGVVIGRWSYQPEAR